MFCWRWWTWWTTPATPTEPPAATHAAAIPDESIEEAIHSLYDRTISTELEQTFDSFRYGIGPGIIGIEARYRAARIAQEVLFRRIKADTPDFSRMDPHQARRTYIELTRHVRDTNHYMCHYLYPTCSTPDLPTHRALNYAYSMSVYRYVFAKTTMAVYRDVIHDNWVRATLKWALGKTLLPPNVVSDIARLYVPPIHRPPR